MGISAELKTEIESMLKTALVDILPTIKSIAEEAVTAASPVAAVVVDPIIDVVDNYVAQLLGNPAPAVTAPTDTDSRVSALEKHVAALTVATGAGTSSTMATAKLATVAVK